MTNDNISELAIQSRRYSTLIYQHIPARNFI